MLCVSMNKKIYSINQLPSECNHDDIKEIWNVDINCEYCRNNLRAPKYYDTKTKVVCCDHNRDYYLISKDELEKILEYGKNTLYYSDITIYKKYIVEDRKIYLVEFDGGNLEKKILMMDLSDQYVRKSI